MSEKLIPKIVVVIPCYKVSKQILKVISNIPEQVSNIILIDDQCPEKTGELVAKNVNDPRVTVLTNSKNLGVGGATKAGYLQAIKYQADIIVKLDGDGQMNPKDIAKLTKAITEEKYNYAKGNRFFTITNVKQMPIVRKFGNLVLSFMSKLSTGYYEIFDPNNGFTAIESDYLTQLPLDEIDNRYFFESDMLYQLNLLGAKVSDVPLPAIYKDEHSSLNIWQSIIIFPKKHLINFVKRIIYTYYLRDFNIASVQLLVGTIFFWWGSVLGLTTWLHNMKNGVSSATGTIMLVGILIITGVQLLLSFLNFDMRSQKRIRF
jgi:glycosyltransferase involved in cell wall biosynthesis